MCSLSRLIHILMASGIPRAAREGQVQTMSKWFSCLCLCHLLMSHWPKQVTRPSLPRVNVGCYDQTDREKGLMCGHFYNLSHIILEEN